MKRKILAAIAYLLIVFGFSQVFWEPINPPGGLTMFDIGVDSEGRIYLACPGPSGALTGIYRSDDNCNTWVRKVGGMDTTHNPHIRSIAIDQFDNIIVGENSRIYRSENYGEDWEKVYHAPTYAYTFNEAEFGFDSIFLVGGEFGNGIVRSGDNGLTWQVVLDFTQFEPDYPEQLTGIFFAPDGQIYACSRTFIGGSGSVYISEDYGMTWSVFYNNGYSHFNSIECDHAGRLLVGGNGIHRYDFNTGNWEYVNYNFLAQDILVVPDSKIFIADPYNGGGFGVVYSGDNGETYEILNSGMIYPDATDFAIDISGRILVCGDSWNSLWRSYDTLVTGINQTNKIAENIDFYCYPNPFTASVHIEFTLTEQIPVELTVFDLNGNHIATLIHKTMPPGGHTITWNGKDLTGKEVKPGIYLLSFAVIGKPDKILKLMKT
jgi:hypothetical protein